MTQSRHAKTIATGLLGLGLLALAAAIIVTGRGSGGAPAQLPVAAASSPVSVVNGVTMVRLDPATQLRSGLGTEALAAISHRDEASVYGSVLDLQPLLELRSRHAAAVSDVTAARAAATVARAELERTRSLYDDQRNVSLKAYQAAQALDRTDQARADAAALALSNLEASAQQQFGSTLQRWAFDPGSSTFARLIARQDSLVRVTLSPGLAVHAAPPRVEVQAGAGRRAPATLISAAAQAEPGSVGDSFLYQVAAALPSGSAVVAYLPTSAQATAAVFVPASAVVWYAGQPWVYVQDSPARFARRPLGQATEAQGGYFVAAGLQPGQRVVATGAGLLLSEEQRPPPSGAGCKDPECD